MAKKYIDADKLIAEIERRKEEYKEDRYMSDYRGQIAYYKDEIYDDLLHFIDSLQQEQSCDTCTNDKGCVTCKDGELWEGKEQPSEDLEKEVEWEWVHREKQEVDLIECAEMDKDEFVRFARHFYELGKQSKEPVSEDLEEAAEEYSRGLDYYHYTGDDPAIAFVAGAEWQKEQFLKGDRLTELDKSYKQAKRELEWFKEGKRQGREQMMEEVTECELVCIKGRLLAVLPMKEFRWTAGDKAHIIIVKEDKK